MHRSLNVPIIVLTTVKSDCRQKMFQPSGQERAVEKRNFIVSFYVTGDEQRSIHFDLVINCYQIMSLLINRDE